jgi:hypothetical protein
LPLEPLEPLEPLPLLVDPYPVVPSHILVTVL